MTFQKTDPTNRFRNGQNNLYSKELFLEFNTLPGVALYTLKNHDYQGLPSLYKLYLSQSDLHEYNFAVQYFEGWPHWEALCKTGWFKPYIESWRSELAVKIEAQAVARIVDIAARGGKDALQANKWLADYQGTGKTRTGRGRPLKAADVALLNRKIIEDQNRLEDDFDRIIGKTN